MYNSVNFALTSGNFENLTIAGVRMNILTCPSDTQNDPATSRRPRPTPRSTTWPIRGSRCPRATGSNITAAMRASRGRGTSAINTTYSAAEFAEYNGVIYNDSTVRIAMVTDGTSNTLMFGEHSHAYVRDQRPGLLCVRQFLELGPLVRHAHGHVLSDGHQPRHARPRPMPARSATMRSPRRPACTRAAATSPCATARSASSRTTISSWTFNTNNIQSYNILPDGAAYSNYVYSFGTAQLGVYQQLSTRPAVK